MSSFTWSPRSGSPCIGIFPRGPPFPFPDEFSNSESPELALVPLNRGGELLSERKRTLNASTLPSMVLSSIYETLGEIRDELRKTRVNERNRTFRAELGFRGELGWQCLACGEDFRTLRDAEAHLFASSHCRRCGRLLPEATAGAAAAICELCAEKFMQARLRRTFGVNKSSIQRTEKLHAVLSLIRKALDSDCDMGSQDIETLHEAEEVLSRELGNPIWEGRAQ